MASYEGVLFGENNLVRITRDSEPKSILFEDMRFQFITRKNIIRITNTIST